MSCSDYINPPTEEFVARGIAGSEIGNYESVVEIDLPEGVSKGILAVNIHDTISDKYEAFTVLVPQGQCMNTNCVVLTKNINKKISLFLYFNNLIKGNKYILNYCFYYNPDIILGTTATPQPTRTATPVQPTRTPTSTVDPSLPTSTPTASPSPTPTNNLSVLVPPLLTKVGSELLNWFNLNDYPVDVLIEAQKAPGGNWTYHTGPFLLDANSSGGAFGAPVSYNYRGKSLIVGSESDWNANNNFTISTSDISDPIFIGSGLYNNNNFPVYAAVEKITWSSFSNGTPATVQGVTNVVIEAYTAKAVTPLLFRVNDYIASQQIAYRARFAKVGPGVNVTNWVSNNELGIIDPVPNPDVVLALRGFSPASSQNSFIKSPIVIQNGLYNNNSFNVNIGLIGHRSDSQVIDYNISRILYDVQSGSTVENYFPNGYIYYVISFIPGMTSSITSFST